MFQRFSRVSTNVRRAVISSVHTARHTVQVCTDFRIGLKGSTSPFLFSFNHKPQNLLPTKALTRSHKLSVFFKSTIICACRYVAHAVAPKRFKMQIINESTPLAHKHPVFGLVKCLCVHVWKCNSNIHRTVNRFHLSPMIMMMMVLRTVVAVLICYDYKHAPPLSCHMFVCTQYIHTLKFVALLLLKHCLLHSCPIFHMAERRQDDGTFRAKHSTPSFSISCRSLRTGTAFSYGISPGTVVIL